MKDLSELVEQLRMMTSQSIPFDKKLWNTRMIADYLGYSLREITDKTTKRPDFPAPLAIGKGRWKGEDVIKWAENQGKKTGRPRKSA